MARDGTNRGGARPGAGRPYGTKCELIGKNIGYASGYKWDKIIYNGEEVYLPNNWNRYI